jgi:hypothetical protein
VVFIIQYNLSIGESESEIDGTVVLKEAVKKQSWDSSVGIATRLLTGLKEFDSQQV